MPKRHTAVKLACENTGPGVSSARQGPFGPFGPFGPLVHSLVHLFGPLLHSFGPFIWSIHLVHLFGPFIWSIHLVHSLVHPSIHWSIGPFAHSFIRSTYKGGLPVVVIQTCFIRSDIGCVVVRGSKQCRVKASLNRRRVQPCGGRKKRKERKKERKKKSVVVPRHVERQRRGRTTKPRAEERQFDSSFV